MKQSQSENNIIHGHNLEWMRGFSYICLSNRRVMIFFVFWLKNFILFYMHWGLGGRASIEVLTLQIRTTGQVGVFGLLYLLFRSYAPFSCYL